MERPFVDLVAIASREAEIKSLTDRLQQNGEASRLWPNPVDPMGQTSAAVFAKLEVGAED